MERVLQVAPTNGFVSPRSPVVHVHGPEEERGDQRETLPTEGDDDVQRKEVLHHEHARFEIEQVSGTRRGRHIDPR